MLFIIDSSLDDAVKNDQHPDHDDACVELERLSHARWRRKLVVFIESTDLSRIVADSPRFSKKAKSVFGHLNRARTFKRELLTRLDIRVRLTAGQRGIVVRDAGGATEITVSISAVPSGLFDRPVLLAENINDARCYLILGDAVIASGEAALPRVGLAAELRGGGGSAIEAEYREIKNAGERLVICVLDSDLRFPACEPSAWRARIVMADDDAPSPFTTSYSTGVYSIESLLPLSSFSILECYAENAAKSHAFEKDLQQWAAHAEREYWRFIALKKGVSCKIFRLQDAEGEYWRPHAEFFEGYSSKMCAKKLDSCRNECVRIPKYPSDLLAEFVNAFETPNSAAVALVAAGVPAAARPLLRELSRKIVAWCCVGGTIGVAGAG